MNAPSTNVVGIASARSLGSGRFETDVTRTITTTVFLFPNEQHQSLPKDDNNTTMLQQKGGEILAFSDHSLASTAPSSIDDDIEYTNEARRFLGTKDHRWVYDQVDQCVERWEISTQEREDLVLLGMRLRDIDHDKNEPMQVVRFLRARPGDVDAAEQMFRNMIQWRMDNKVDTILKDYQPPQELVDYYPGAVLQGLDKEGDPILLGRDGVQDSIGLLNHFGHDEMIKHAIWLREMICNGSWMKEYNDKQGRPVKQVTIINDIGGLNLFQYVKCRPLLSMYANIMRFDQDYYPESAKKIIIINVPPVFQVLWKVIHGFFDEGVVEKMVFIGSRHCQKILSQYVDLELMPECIIPGIGKGRPIEGMNTDFQGGPFLPS